MMTDILRRYINNLVKGYGLTEEDRQELMRLAEEEQIVNTYWEKQNTVEDNSKSINDNEEQL